MSVGGSGFLECEASGEVPETEHMGPVPAEDANYDPDLIPGIETGEDVIEFYGKYGQDRWVLHSGPCLPLACCFLVCRQQADLFWSFLDCFSFWYPSAALPNSHFCTDRCFVLCPCSAVKFFYCNRAKDQLRFRPYDLVVVPRQRVGCKGYQVDCRPRGCRESLVAGVPD